MSSRIKVVLLDKTGQVRDYRMQGIRNYVKTYFPQVEFTGNRAKDLKIAKEVLLQLDMFVFSWKEAKEARGRERLVKIFQKELKEAQNSIVAREVMERVKGSLRGKKLEVPKEVEVEEIGLDWADVVIAAPQPARPQQARRIVYQQARPPVQELVEGLRARQNER